MVCGAGGLRDSVFTILTRSKHVAILYSAIIVTFLGYIVISYALDVSLAMDGEFFRGGLKGIFAPLFIGVVCSITVTAMAIYNYFKACSKESLKDTKLSFDSYHRREIGLQRQRTKSKLSPIFFVGFYLTVGQYFFSLLVVFPCAILFMLLFELG